NAADPAGTGIATEPAVTTSGAAPAKVHPHAWARFGRGRIAPGIGADRALALDEDIARDVDDQTRAADGMGQDAIGPDGQMAHADRFGAIDHAVIPNGQVV